LEVFHAPAVALGGCLVVDQRSRVIHTDDTLGLFLNLGKKVRSSYFQSGFTSLGAFHGE